MTSVLPPSSSRLRRATGAINWAWSSAFSRGAGYEALPPGRAFSIRSVQGYFLDFSEKTRAPAAAVPETLTPAGLAQLALGWWERSLASGDVGGEDFLR